MLHPRCVCALGLLGLLGVSAARAGDIDPPMGPVQGTMKTLDAIEPRDILKTLASSPDAVHLITQPGQYVLTEDISVPSGKSGIVVELPPGVEGDVSIDLNGFSIVGQPGSLHAVHCKAGGGGGGRTYTLMSSFPTSWRSMGGSGLMVDGGGRVWVSGVRAENCAGDGFHIENTAECVLSISASGCGGDGVEAILCDQFFLGAGSEMKESGEKGGASDTNYIRGCSGHGVIVTGGSSDVRLAASVLAAGLDGVHVEDAARCELLVDVHGCGGVGVRVDEVGQCDAAVRVSGSASHGVHLSKIPAGFVTKKSFGQLAGKKRGAVSSIGGHGILAEDCGRLVVSGVGVSDCALDGLHVAGASSLRVADWRDDDCDGDGIEAFAVGGVPLDVHISDSSGHGAGGNGLSLRGRDLLIEFERRSGSALHGMDLEGDIIEMRGCSSNNNAQCGVSARTRKSVSESNNIYNDNGWQGSLLLPALGSVQEKANKSKCSARGNGFALPGGGAGFEFSGISSVSMHECDSSANAGSGVVVADMDRDGRLDLVTCASNGAHGLHVTSNQGLPSGRLHLRLVTCDGNTSNGLFLEGTSGGEVSECVAIGNGGTGIFIIGSGHVVRSNNAGGNSGAAMIVSAPGNVVGPLVDELSVAGNCNPAANYVH